MKVTSSNLHPGASIEKAQNGDKTAIKSEVAPKKVQGDTSTTSTVEISDEARLLSRAMTAVHEAPQKNSPERIQELKTSVRNGTYKVDAAKVADRLVEEHLLSHFGKNSF